jgi:heat shock protein HslJ
MGCLAFILLGFSPADHAQTASGHISTTTENYPVLTRNNGNEVTLLLQRTGGAASASTGEESALQDLPATFTGMMPCADCPGIHYRLDLKPDHSFSSQMVYDERDATFNDSGSWELADNGKMLVLKGKGKVAEKFSVRDSDTLRRLDMNGNEIVSPFNYDLKRVSKAAPGESQSTSDATLENTHWNLTALGEAPISTDSPQTEAFLVLDPGQHRVSGSGGCNRLMGSYELNGDKLTFGQMAGTMMMCPQGMDTEQAFLKSLGQVSKWKITGQSLQLLDSGGKVLAQFKAGEK